MALVCTIRDSANYGIWWIKQFWWWLEYASPAVIRKKSAFSDSSDLKDDSDDTNDGAELLPGSCVTLICTV